MSVPERPSKRKRHHAWHVLLNVRPLPRKKASTYGYNHNVQVVPLAQHTTASSLRRVSYFKLPKRSEVSDPTMFLAPNFGDPASTCTHVGSHEACIPTHPNAFNYGTLVAWDGGSGCDRRACLVLFHISQENINFLHPFRCKHNIIQISNSNLWDRQYFMEYFSNILHIQTECGKHLGNISWKHVPPQNIVMDLNNVMSSPRVNSFKQIDFKNT